MLSLAGLGWAELGWTGLDGMAGRGGAMQDWQGDDSIAGEAVICTPVHICSVSYFVTSVAERSEKGVSIRGKYCSMQNTNPYATKYYFQGTETGGEGCRVISRQNISV